MLCVVCQSSECDHAVCGGVSPVSVTMLCVAVCQSSECDHAVCGGVLSVQ